MIGLFFVALRYPLIGGVDHHIQRYTLRRIYGVSTNAAIRPNKPSLA